MVSDDARASWSLQHSNDDDLGGFQSPTGIDGRVGYNPRGPYLPGGARGVGMYPVPSIAPLVDMPYGGGRGLAPRYPAPALLTSTRVSGLEVWERTRARTCHSLAAR